MEPSATAALTVSSDARQATCAQIGNTIGICVHVWTIHVLSTCEQWLASMHHLRTHVEQTTVGQTESPQVQCTFPDSHSHVFSPHITDNVRSRQPAVKTDEQKHVISKEYDSRQWGIPTQIRTN
jgi:hypothetical protein